MKWTTYVLATFTLLLIGIAVSLHSPQPAGAQGTYQTFTETGKTMQYVERALFQGHPDSPGLHDMIISQSGNFLYQPKDPVGTPTQPAPTQVPASGATTPTSTPCPISFTDVPPSNTFYSYIRCLVCRGVISGYNDGTFRPNNNVIRGQMARFISNAAGYNDYIPPTRQTFTDVPNNSNSPFWLYVERVYLHGVVGGYFSSTLCSTTGVPCFLPGANVTRGQTAKFVSNAARYANYIPSTQQTFTDVPNNHTFWLYVERAALHGVIGGYNSSQACTTGVPCYQPANNVTRGQASKIVANTFFPNCDTPNRAKP